MLETNKELAQSFLGINGHSWKFQHNRSVDKKPQRARSWMWWCVIEVRLQHSEAEEKNCGDYFLLTTSSLTLCYHHQTSGSQIPMGIIWPSKKMFLRFSGWIASGKHCLDLRRPSWCPLHEASDERDMFHDFSMKFQTYATYLSCLVSTVQLVIDGIGIKTYFAAKPPYHARQRSEQQLKHGCRQKTSTIDVLRKWALKKWRSNQYTVTVVKWLKETGFENAIAQKQLICEENNLAMLYDFIHMKFMYNKVNFS